MKINILLTRETNGFNMDANVLQTYITENEAKMFLPHEEPDKADVSIFIDSILHVDKLKYAKLNILLVNPEVFLNSKETKEAQIDIYHKLDYMICKSKYGAEFMLQIKKKYNFKYHVQMFRFTTIFPPLDMKIERSNDCILHLAGANNWKNTPDVIKTWLEYSDLPPLIVVLYGIGLKSLSDYLTPDEINKAFKLKNITWHKKELPFDDIIRYKHKYRIHLCPSLAEGYGHYINEARISKAVVITTDAPPMNELITPKTGIIVECLPTQIHAKRNDYKMCYVEPRQIYDAVRKALALPDKEKDNMGERVYKAYEKDTEFFSTHLNTFLKNISQKYTKSNTKDSTQHISEDFSETFVEEYTEPERKIYEPIVFKQIKITSKYEKARLISVRAQQIALGGPVMVDTQGEVDPIKIALMEYDQRRIPDIIIRHLPKGTETTEYNVNKRIVD
jgi:DNA-directed RNA polymerase subunit K/omega